MSADVLEQMRETFRSEALDLLIELDSALLQLEAEPAGPALVHRVFRAIHTIKGSGATAGFAHLARFAHKMEEAFDLAREGRLAVSPELIDCGLNACDVLRLILEDQAEDSVVAGELDAASAFARLLPSSGSALSEPGAPAKPAAEVRAAFEIVFKPHREMFYSGSDPVTLLDDLRELGQAHIAVHVEQVPPLPSLEAENCYLWWEILLVTDRDVAAIRDVFVFVADECEVRIRLRDDQAEAVALLGSVPPEAFELFVAECEDLLLGMEADALALEADPASRERLDSLFRGVHSIKGSVGLLLGHVQGASLIAGHPLQLLLRVAHGLESLLDPFRSAAAGPASEETIQTSLETADAIRTQLSSLTHRGAAVPVSPALLERLGIRSEAPREHAPAAAARDAAFLNTISQCVDIIQSCFRRLENASEPAAPILETYLRGLKTFSSAARYRHCAELEQPVALQLQILEAAMKAGALLSAEQRSRLGGAFEKARSVVEAMSSQDTVIADPDKPVSEKALRSSPAVDRAVPPASSSTIRIEQTKLDRLMRLVGELLVARGAFPLLIRKLHDGADGAAVAKDLKEAGSNISRISDDLQTTIMSIRMLPVKTVFQKFPRLVRDLARSLEKEVRLVVEGEGIELDKTILEQIGDPLVHVIRNSVDHGFEMPEERLAKGKDRSGLLTLRAFHETGGVVIEVADDGKGLDADALKRKAVGKGLLSSEAAAAMTDEAAFQLVFLPGLSTAAKVTDVSGRGVGMDVVRSNVRNLQGTIEIRSRQGAGTTLLIRLPTSLMVSKGILLQAGSQQYILPLSNIRDMVKLPPQAIHRHQGQAMAQVRGTIYSIFNLAGILGLAPDPAGVEASIAIVEAGAVRYGLVVDKFLTEVEVLVKPLAGGLERCKEFQGAAIMGDGRVVLVLNALECYHLGSLSLGSDNPDCPRLDPTSCS